MLARLAALGGLFVALRSPAQQTRPSPLGAMVPHRYLVVFRNGAPPSVAQAYSRTGNTRVLRLYSSSNIAVVQSDSESDDSATVAALAAQPNVAIVVHDRIVSAHSIVARPALSVLPPPNPYDTYYTSTPQNWAVVQSGGYGANVPGGLAHGPWDITRGAGVRIAILDSGVDANHPDIAPNLELNLSEIDQTPNSGLPSPCDTGSPQDQQGHGTWVASLAAAAAGPGTGLTIGVAPAATLLNIKVIERLPDPSSPALDIATQCRTGQAGGLLSWVIEGIDDAVANHAERHQSLIRHVGRSEHRGGCGTTGALQPRDVRCDAGGRSGHCLSGQRWRRVVLPALRRASSTVTRGACRRCVDRSGLRRKSQSERAMRSRPRDVALLFKFWSRAPRHRGTRRKLSSRKFIRDRHRPVGLDPRRVQYRHCQHRGWGTVGFRAQLRLLQPRPCAVRAGHGNQRVRSSCLRRSRAGARRTSELEGRRGYRSFAQRSDPHRFAPRSAHTQYRRGSPVRRPDVAS